tara:strand:+ start:75 stop:971 length:897 start_codon:yes stop_codon:yes gene_type:complete
MNKNYYYQNAGGIYVDNALNRRLGRVGKTYGKKTNKVEKPKKTSPKKIPMRSQNNKSIKEIYHLSFSCNILIFDKLWDAGFTISSLDKSKKPNKEINKYINFNKLIQWHKKQIMDMGPYLSTDKMKVTINDVKKESEGIMTVKITVESDVKTDEDTIRFMGTMIGTVDDDGNYPIRVKKSSKYKTTALVGAELISFRTDDQPPIQRKRPSSKVSPKNDKTHKITNTKTHGRTRRLSAGAYYRKHGKNKVIGDICQIRKEDKEVRCLLKRSNGTVYWAYKSKSGVGQEACEKWKKNCKE